MKDLQKSMRYSLLFGFSGAIAIPIFYEIYANISKGAGIFLITGFVVLAGIKMSALSLKSALIGITACIAYSGILGMVGYVIIHPAAVSFLNAHSKYFQLSFKEQAIFLGNAIGILLCMYLICFARKGFERAFRQLKSNRQKTGEYISNAFADDENVDKQ